MKILIVEDDENSRVYLERALKSQSYTVESTANGVLALEKALLSPPDMIISDILVPEMDGFDLCRKVKANEKLQHIPFIFYTATFIEKKDEELAMSLGASRFIVKPFKMQELFKIITDVIEEHKEKKLPVPKKTLVEIEKIDEMYSGTIARKLDKKVAQLQKEIAERIQAEETLRQSEEKFSKAFHATPDAIEITRFSDERIIEVNEVFVRRSGYSRDEVVGHTTMEFNLWANPQDRERYFTTMREQGNVREQESKFRMKSGEILDGLVSGETFSMGEEKYILTIIRDITKRKQAEDSLRESEARYRGLHESMADCFIQVAMSGEIVDVNRSYLEMLGYTAEEVKQRYKDITPAKWNEFEQKIVDTQIITRGYSDVYEKEYIRKDGTVFPVELRTYLLRNKEGKPFGMWTIIRDITQRKKTEEVHLENVRLEAADKAKSEFLANMSHELRTPLNASIGFSELLNMGMAGELSEKQKHYVEIILSSNQFLLTLINDILDLSKIEAGKIDLVPAKMSVPVTIKETLTLIKEKAMKHKVILKTEFDTKLECIEADRQRFKQVLFNLLSNAVKFSKEEGGTVTITAKKEGDMAQISISDTGIGIKEENVGKLFRKFEQLEKGISQKYGGTGLGLAITKQLVELHGGRIFAESKYGEGSTFTFLLPIEAKKTDVK